MKKLIYLTILFLPMPVMAQWVSNTHVANSKSLSQFSIRVASDAAPVIKTAVRLLQQDISVVLGNTWPLRSDTDQTKSEIFVTLLDSSIVENKGITPAEFRQLYGQHEAFLIRSTTNQTTGNMQVLIVGSDPRGVAYGIMTLSQQLGVSPWHWWADVPITRQRQLWVTNHFSISDQPLVRYRGIFINDEAPALSNWAKEKFGGFNHRFYEKVFELLLRLKANYIWPAMWGNAFYDDDPENIAMAERYGIIIGTSHHEPMMRAHDEWRRYHPGEAWNYETNAGTLQEFWREGIRRAVNEKIVTVGMRGDGDEPMSRETATDLLEKIVDDQRGIIASATGKPAAATPQLWALYKEVQDYFDQGMRVPDDVTLLLCDDNWGNLRRLPNPSGVSRKGGYGIYYHFDYVGGPRNYKWINTNPLPRIWEQMHLAWQFQARQIWIVNVGDIKPMELPISFFLDYAWNPTRIDAAGVSDYTRQWAAAQLGTDYQTEVAVLLASYSKYNSRRKPELLDENTYSLVAGEWDRVRNEWMELQSRAEKLAGKIPARYQNAYYQLVLHPILACSNLNEMYYHVAKNKFYFQQQSYAANYHAGLAEKCFAKDSLLTRRYHRLNNGKWNHLMSQTHIGYTYWQQPDHQTMPKLNWLLPKTREETPPTLKPDMLQSRVPAALHYPAFFETSTGVSVEASHFSTVHPGNGSAIGVLPDHGRTGSAVTLQSAERMHLPDTNNAPSVEYEFYPLSEGRCSITAYFSPTLNLFNEPAGLRYAISVDAAPPQIISINAEDTATGQGIWNKWVADNIIQKKTSHQTSGTGPHRIRIWLLDTGVVLQRLLLQYHDADPGYLGPPETIVLPKYMKP